MGLIQLNRWYSPQEICDLLHIKNDSNYSKTVKKRLDKMGVEYRYETKKVIFLGGSVKIISQISMQTLGGMKSAGNRGVLQSSFQVPHIHVLLVAPLRAGYMAQPGTDQHEGGVAIRERAHHPSAGDRRKVCVNDKNRKYEKHRLSQEWKKEQIKIGVEEA